MKTVYVLRYVDGVDLKDRAHAETLGRWPTWTAADDAREASPKRDQLEAFALVLLGTQAWRRVDLLEHYLVSREVSEEKARELVDTYPHHLLHTHHQEEES